MVNCVETFYQQSISIVKLSCKFFESFLAKGHSDETIWGYKKNLKRFLIWCFDRDITTVCEINKDVIERYQHHFSNLNNTRTGKPLSPEYCLHSCIAISLFCRFLTENGYFIVNPAEDMVYPKVSKRIPHQVLTHEQAMKIVLLPDSSTPDGIRDRAILETLYSTAVRRQELATIVITNINFEHGVLLVCGKGKKDRYIPIGQYALNWIERYLYDVRPSIVSEKQPDILFRNRFGDPFEFNGISQLVRKYVRASGVDKKGSCHLFRHTAATLMLENGADIRYVQEFLGHTNLISTEIYTRVSICKLKEVHSLTHPAKMYPTKTNQILESLK